MVRAACTRRPSVGCDAEVLPLEPLGDLGEEDPPYFFHALEDVSSGRDESILLKVWHQLHE